MTPLPEIVEKALAQLGPEVRDQIKTTLEKRIEDAGYNLEDPSDLEAFARFASTEIDKAPKGGSSTPTSVPTTTRPLTPFDLADFAKNGIPPVPWLIEGWVAEEDIALIAGVAYVGKTTLAADLAIALATGREWLGIKPSRPMRTMFVQEEQGKAAIGRLFLQLGAPLASENLRIYVMEEVRLDTEEGTARLEAAIAEWKAEVVILDSVSQVFASADEKDANAIGAVYARLFRLRQKYGVVFVLIHHYRKPGQFKVDPLDLIRGSTAHTTGPDTIWAYDRLRPGEAASLKQLKRRGPPPVSIVVGYSETEDMITLTGEGPVEDDAPRISAASEWIVRYVADGGRTCKRAEIVSADLKQTKPFGAKLIDKALVHAVEMKALKKAAYGYYEVARA